MQAQARVLSTQAWPRSWLAPWCLALFGALALLLCSPSARAQDAPVFSQQELDQMLAPIALYPDPLLSQVLMAATYPLEVVEAERWSLANPSLHGTQAVQAVQDTRWDPSVQSLVAFPQTLSMLSRQLTWTERLGDAYLAQPDQVMDTVQVLRQRAYAAGNLRSNDYLRVQSQDGSVLIMPVDPAVAYELYYDPRLVYGTWWWPQYPPVYWAPWPGFRARASFDNGFLWGTSIALGADFFFGDFDWHRHYIHMHNPNRDVWRHFAPAPSGNGTPWQHAPDHRRGVAYRGAAVQSHFAPAAAATQNRMTYRGHAVQPAQHDVGGAPLHERRRAPPAPALTPQQMVQPTPQPMRPDRPHALEGIGRAPDVRQFSERGHASLQQPHPGIVPVPSAGQQGGRQTTGHDRAGHERKDKQ